MRFLIVEDDFDLADLLSYAVRREGHTVTSAGDGVQGFQRWRNEQPDLVLAAVAIPKMDGFELCRAIRAESDTPVILLSGTRQTEEDVLHGLRLGADDYLTKPFSIKLLLARATAILRRSSASLSPERNQLAFGDLTLDPQRNEVTRDDSCARLTPLEFRLVRYLAANRGQVMPTDTIVEAIWGYDESGDSALVKSHIHNIRKKIEPDPANPRYFQTVPGVGYTLAI